MNFNKIFSVFLILGVLCLSGCSVSVPEDEMVKLSLNSDYSRVIVPSSDDYKTSDFSYVLTGVYGSESSKTLGTWDGSTVSGATFSVKPGSWTFTLTASKGDSEILSGSCSENVTTETTGISISLKEISGTEATGDFVFNFTCPSGYNFIGSLLKIGDSTSQTLINSTGHTSFAGTGAAVEVKATGLSSGYYTLMVVISDSYLLYSYYTDVVQIAAGLTTTGSGSVEAANLNQKYSITYTLDSGTNPDEAVTAYTKYECVVLPVPTKENYTFAGWYTNSGLSEQTGITAVDGTYYFNKDHDQTRNVVLYAKWLAAKTVTTVSSWSDLKTAIDALDSENTTVTEYSLSANSENLTAWNASSAIYINAPVKITASEDVTITRLSTSSLFWINGYSFELGTSGSKIVLDGNSSSYTSSTAGLICLEDSNADVSIGSCVEIKNAKNTGDGSAIYCYMGNISMNGVTVDNNTGSYAVYIDDDFGSASITACNFSGNYIDSEKADLYVGTGSVLTLDGECSSVTVFVAEKSGSTTGQISTGSSLSVSDDGKITVSADDYTVTDVIVSDSNSKLSYFIPGDSGYEFDSEGKFEAVSGNSTTVTTWSEMVTAASSYDTIYYSGTLDFDGTYIACTGKQFIPTAESEILRESTSTYVFINFNGTSDSHFGSAAYKTTLNGNSKTGINLLSSMTSGTSYITNVCLKNNGDSTNTTVGGINIGKGSVYLDGCSFEDVLGSSGNIAKMNTGTSLTLNNCSISYTETSDSYDVYNYGGTLTISGTFGNLIIYIDNGGTVKLSGATQDSDTMITLKVKTISTSAMIETTDGTSLSNYRIAAYRSSDGQELTIDNNTGIVSSSSN